MQTPRLLSTATALLLLAACDPAPKADDGTKPAAGDGTPAAADGGGKAAEGGDEAKGAESDDKPADGADKAAKEEAATDSRTKKVPTKLDKKTPEELKATKAKMLKLLNEGRGLVKSKDYPGGIAKYEELLKIDPHYRAALGELGFAHYRAGSYDKAHHYTTLALRQAKEDKQKGMLLYNLGLVAEKKGNPELARDHFARSLKHRPNAVVQKKYDALAGGEAGAAPAKVPQGLAVIASGLKDIGAACEAAVADSWCGAELCEPYGKAEADGMGFLYAAEPGILGCFHPVVKTDAGWTVFEMALIEQWGSEIKQEILESKFSAVTVAGASKAGEISFNEHVSERNWDLADETEDGTYYPEDDFTMSDGVVLCGVEKGQARCTRPMLKSYKFTLADKDEPSKSYTASLLVEGANLVVSAVVSKDVKLGSPDTADEGFAMLKAGGYPIAQLWAPAGAKK